MVVAPLKVRLGNSLEGPNASADTGPPTGASSAIPLVRPSVAPMSLFGAEADEALTGGEAEDFDADFGAGAGDWADTIPTMATKTRARTTIL